MKGLANLPWYVYILIAVTAFSFIASKMPAVLKVFGVAANLFKVFTRKDFAKHPSGSSLDENSIKALLTGAINGEQTSCYIDSLETGIGSARLISALEEYWGITDSVSAKSTLDWLRHEGHRAYYSRIYHHIERGGTNEELISIAGREFADDDPAKASEYMENLLETLEDLKTRDSFTDEDFVRGILSWDMGRLVTVARMSYDRKFITEEEAWEYINDAYRNCRQAFASWEELSKSYVLGRAMWGGEGMMLDGIRGIAEKLLTHENSPWKEYAF